jgi:hypothetical protein
MEWTIISRTYDGPVTKLKGYLNQNPKKCDYTTIDIEVEKLPLDDALKRRTTFHEAETLVVERRDIAYLIRVVIGDDPSEAARRELDETVEHVSLDDVLCKPYTQYSMDLPVMVLCCLYGLAKAVV